MLNNVMIGRYYPTYSQIHKMNPLSKIFCTFFFIVILFLYNDLFFTTLLLGFVVLIALMSNVGLGTYMRAVWSLKSLVIAIIIINLMFGIDLQTISIAISRLILIVLYTSILTLTTPPTELTHGLEQFFKPLSIIGVPVNKMALMLTLAIRFIPTIIDQSNKIMRSQTCRGIDYTGFKIKDKIIGIKTLLLPLFVHSFKRADELSLSMELRFYNFNKKRTNFRMNKWRFFDTYMFSIHLIILVTVIYKEFFI